MPELPDVIAYCQALAPRVVGQSLQDLAVIGPFVLRTFEPPIEEAVGCSVHAVSRVGKRIVLELGDERRLVFHLMIAGRLRWMTPRAKPPAKITLATFDFSGGRLVLTEASQRKRAALYYLANQAALHELNPGGVDVLQCDESTFAAALRRENRTLKRILTDPRTFDGIGNAYSDEILHAARLSPIALSQRLTEEETARLHAAARRVLAYWIDALGTRFATKFPGPGEITAFRPEFAVHGKFGQPCPDCGRSVQRIVYAERETNYCAGCQTKGRILADRSLSRLLKDDWPQRIEDI